MTTTHTRRPRTTPRDVLKSAAAALAVCALAACGGQAANVALSSATPTTTTTDPAAAHLFPVTRVIDGDTIEVLLPDGTSTAGVRLLGIDTPETTNGKNECGGQEATQYVRDRLDPDGGGGTVTVRLTPDPTQQNEDRYGRLLRYVQVPTGTTNATGEPGWEDVGFRMIRQGLAKEYTYDKAYELQQDYRSAQSAARSDGEGGWTLCGWTA